MLREFQLHGPLAEKFGSETKQFSADNIHQLFKALEVYHRGFKTELRKYSHIAVVKERNNILESIKPEEFSLSFGQAEKIHLVADVTAAGAETVALAFGTYGSATYYAAYVIYTIAVMYAMGQVIQGMQDTIKTETAKPDNKSSLFNGPENRSMQGARVQLNYGIFRVGSVTVNQQMTGVRQTIIKLDNLVVTTNSSGSLNIFANDYYVVSPSITSFTVNGVTTTVNGTNTSVPGVSITLDSSGILSVADTSGTEQNISVDITATDTSISMNMNQTCVVSIVKPSEVLWGAGGGGPGSGDGADGGGGGGPGGDDGGGPM